MATTTTMQSVASELAGAPELNDFNIKCVRQSDLILHAMRTGTLRDSAAIQSAHDRARALAFVVEILGNPDLRSYLSAVNTEKLSEADLAILHNYFNVWRKGIVEAVEVGKAFEDSTMR